MAVNLKHGVLDMCRLTGAAFYSFILLGPVLIDLYLLYAKDILLDFNLTKNAHTLTSGNGEQSNF